MRGRRWRAQFVTARLAPWIGAAAGSIALALGVILIVVAAATDSGSLYMTGSIVAGAGFGAAFLGGLRSLVTAIPPASRASVMSAFYVAAYASLSIPAVLAGLVVTRLGLDETFELFGSVVSVLALVVAFEAWRTRPPRRLSLSCGAGEAMPLNKTGAGPRRTTRWGATRVETPG